MSTVLRLKKKIQRGLKKKREHVEMLSPRRSREHFLLHGVKGIPLTKQLPLASPRVKYSLRA